MTHDNAPAYGLWSLVVLNSLAFIIFAFSFTRPKTSRDWRSFDVFAAFIVAIFYTLCTMKHASCRYGYAHHGPHAAQ